MTFNGFDWIVRASGSIMPSIVSRNYLDSLTFITPVLSRYSNWYYLTKKNPCTFKTFSMQQHLANVLWSFVAFILGKSCYIKILFQQSLSFGLFLAFGWVLSSKIRSPFFWKREISGWKKGDFVCLIADMVKMDESTLHPTPYLRPGGPSDDLGLVSFALLLLRVKRLFSG